MLGSDLVALGEPDAGLAELRESRRLAGVAGTLDTLVVAHHNLALNLLLADHRDEAVEEAIAGRDLARRIGLERRYAPYLAGVAPTRCSDRGAGTRRSRSPTRRSPPSRARDPSCTW